MSLALHILRKDIRHLFPEILLTLALTLAFATTAPVQWASNSSGAVAGGSYAGVIAVLLRILLPIAWLILIARLVHEESLVGDRQFWVSRPYPWNALLLAKLLFVLAFLVVPFFLMQLYLLHHATFTIAPALPDLLLFQLRLAAIVFIPFFVLATVTSSFARQFLVALVAFLYVVGCFTIGGQAMSHRFLAPGILTTALILLTLANLAVILLQYARRRTRLARITLAALPAVLLILILAAPARLLIEHAFPSTALSPQTTLLFDPDPARRQPDSNKSPLVFSDGYIILSLPVQIPSLPPGLRLKGQAISLTLDTPSGLHWTSPYQGVDADLSTRNAHPAIDVPIPADIFNRFKNTPADLHLSLAVDRSTTGAPQMVTANLPAFATPGRGLCLVTSLGIPSNCLFPLRPPAPIDLSLQTSDQPCGSTTPATIRPQTTFTGTDDTFLRFDFDPVVTSPLNLSIDRERTGNTRPAFLCPGTPVTVTPHTVVGHQRLTLTAPAVILAPYARHQMTRADGQTTITPEPQAMRPEPRNP